MLRMIFLGTAFVGITAGLLIFQPGASQLRWGSDDPSFDEGAIVTRARSDTGLVRPAAMGAGDPDAGSAAATLSALVQRAQSQEAAEPSPDTNPALAIAAAVKAARENQEDVLARTTQALLAELGQDRRGAEDVALEAMTQTVLAKLGGASSSNAPKPAVLENLVVQALRQGQSDTYLDALLNEARNTGQITVPDALITSDNKVDTATLLASLVQRSVRSEASAEVTPARTTSDADRVRPQTRRLARAQSYTVQPGDSLAAISFRFYGETFRYTDIFEANRDKITSPDRIRVGQTLVIPVL